MALWFAWLVLAPLCAALSILTLYLLCLTVAAVCATTRSSVSPAVRTRRFAVLVPAHNEQALIGRLLGSLQRLDYPDAEYDVCVVADNCTDATATIARGMGARTYERSDRQFRAKGFALRWLLQQLRDEGRRYDAVVVVDADSVVASNFLEVMNLRLEHGAQVIQAYYSVANAAASRLTGLRYAALAAVHYLRPLGRSVFRLSCGLKGNGMCFAADVVERFGWNWFTLAEDVEFHLALVRAGIRVEFAPETSVEADMPLTLAQAATQNARWEQGRLQLVRKYVPGLLLSGLCSGSAMQLEAAAEQLIPPLSVPFALSGLCAAGGLAVGDLALVGLGVGNLLGQMVYLLVALKLVRAPRSAFVALSAAPVYIVWKLGVYARALLTRRSGAWVRTARITPSAG